MIILKIVQLKKLQVCPFERLSEGLGIQLKKSVQNIQRTLDQKP